MDMKLEGEWSELLFSYLTASWYDWGVSSQLSASNTHCWSVTSGYYAHYMLAASLLNMYRGTYKEERLVKRIASNHSKMCNFLSNNKYNKEYSFRLQFNSELANIMKISEDEMDRKLQIIGDSLFSAKKARESHTYHVIVVSHQTVNIVDLGDGGTVKPAKLVSKISETMLDIVPILHTFVLTMVEKLLLGLEDTVKHYHLKHLIQEVDDFYKLAEDERILPLPDSMDNGLKRLKDFAVEHLDNTKIEHYSDFEESLLSFTEKKENYQDLQSNFDYLNQALVNVKKLNI
ncbi:hypothetical protein [Salipaludibacillus sp. CF4.18]|uniref:hypothetical protein n=1 Tax=Salipaludibacillus sp. CF4.18 TaxID=3373081 RepID=UPI003EE7190E